jgi:hypothetical protein
VSCYNCPIATKQMPIYYTTSEKQRNNNKRKGNCYG